jgi:hypothetical protein
MGYRFSGRLYLLACYPRSRARLETETAKTQSKTAGLDHSLPGTSFLLLPVFLFFGLQEHGLFLGPFFFLENFAFIEPHFYTHCSISVESCGFSVINAGTEGLKRHFAFG